MCVCVCVRFHACVWVKKACACVWVLERERDREREKNCVWERFTVSPVIKEQSLGEAWPLKPTGGPHIHGWVAWGPGPSRPHPSVVVNRQQKNIPQHSVQFRFHSILSNFLQLNRLHFFAVFNRPYKISLLCPIPVFQRGLVLSSVQHWKCWIDPLSSLNSPISRVVACSLMRYSCLFCLGRHSSTA